MWFAVDFDGSEWRFEDKPVRLLGLMWYSELGAKRLRPGAIRNWVGKDLTWADEPVEIR